MSMMAMANAAVARRLDFPPHNTVPQGFAEIALAAAGHDPVKSVTGGAGVDGGATPSSSQAMNTAFNVVFGYVPTEVLTLYVAVLAAIHTDHISTGDWVAFWCFFAATPVVVWLLYAAKVKAGGKHKQLPMAFSKWPLWEMSAALIAFFAWAFALPGNPFTAWSAYSSALAGIIVLVASTILGLLAPLFQRAIQP